MSILQINEKLEAAGRSLKASGASNGQSIAGCISTGTHGAAFQVGAVHEAIVGGFAFWINIFWLHKSPCKRPYSFFVYGIIYHRIAIVFCNNLNGAARLYYYQTQK
jgi:hypothetical protein